MNMGLLQGIYTIILMVAFIILCLWAYWPSNKKKFEKQANLPCLLNHEDKDSKHE